MRFHECLLEGDLCFKNSVLSVAVVMDYDHDGYLDVKELYVTSTRRNDVIKASQRLTLKFQEKHWSFLYDSCLQRSRDMQEYYNKKMS